jgi:hypothetical protein
MKSKAWTTLFAWAVGILCVAQAGAQPEEGSRGMLIPAETGRSQAIAGTYFWDDQVVTYESETTGEDMVTARVLDADGNTIAEGAVTSDTAMVELAGVKITSETEISEEEGMKLDSFLESKEAEVLRALATALAEDTPPEDRGSLVGLNAIAFIVGEGPGAYRTALGDDCFGCCGPGCWGCWLAGNCYTMACAAHDGCVEMYGHRRCLRLLAVAIVSYKKECL